MFVLQSENLTQLGGRMGTEYITTNFRKYFKSLKAAKAYAEKDYGKKLIWWFKHKKKKEWETDDLGHVMYNINKIETED